MRTTRAGWRWLTTCSILLAIGLMTATPLFAATGPRATGGGTFQESNQDETAPEQTSTFAFNAITHKNGTVTGHLKYHWRAEGTTWRVDIDCLQVVGNQAALGGTLTDIQGTPSDENFFEGQTVIFFVQDNGQGGAASPDRISDVYYNAPTCDILPLPQGPGRFEFPLNGNIQVQT